MRAPDEYLRLYDIQDAVLKKVNAMETEFYLTGGTALSRGYLKHRYSDDLDFFVSDSPHYALWTERIVQGLQSGGEWKVRLEQREPRYTRLSLGSGELAIKMEFINDVPARVGSPHVESNLGLIDSAENIFANKISALIAREEPKDLADVWGLCTLMNLSIHDALHHAQGKAAGIFPPDVGRILCSVTREDYEVIRWITPPSFDSFQASLARIGESLLLAR